MNAYTRLTELLDRYSGRIILTAVALTLLLIVPLVAMAANVVIAGLAGGAIPLVLRHYGLDPALSSAVFVTTVTDVAGFLIFLGLAAALITSLL